METLTLPARLEHLEKMVDFVLTAGEQRHFSQSVQQKLRLAAEEILVNVISYAYPGGEGELTITLDETPGRPGLRVEVSDSGIPFDPLAKPDPDVNAPIKDRQIGGLGIYLLKQLMDEVAYRHENDKNILTFIKYSEGG